MNTKYKFIKKENKWNDKQSPFNEKYISGSISINDLLPVNKRTILLENMGIPIGLILENNTQTNKCEKKSVSAETITSDYFDNLLLSVSKLKLN